MLRYVTPDFTDLSGGYFMHRPNLSKFSVHREEYLRFYTILANQVIANTSTSQFTLQQYAKSDDNVRMWLDLDSEKEEITDTMIEAITSSMIAEYKRFHHLEKEINTTYLVYRNSYDGSRKVHVHFPYLVTTKKRLRHITKQVMVNSSYASCIDLTLSGLRLLYSIKWKDNKPMWKSKYLPEATTDIKRIVLTFVMTSIRAFDWEQVPPLKEEYLYLETPITRAEESFLSPEALVIITKLVTQLEDTYTATYEETRVILKRITSSYCQVCKKNHDSDNAYIYCASGCVYLHV